MNLRGYPFCRSVRGCVIAEVGSVLYASLDTDFAFARPKVTKINMVRASDGPFEHPTPLFGPPGRCWAILEVGLTMYLVLDTKLTSPGRKSPR